MSVGHDDRLTRCQPPLLGDVEEGPGPILQVTNFICRLGEMRGELVFPEVEPRGRVDPVESKSDVDDDEPQLTVVAEQLLDVFGADFSHWLRRKNRSPLVPQLGEGHVLDDPKRRVHGSSMQRGITNLGCASVITPDGRRRESPHRLGGAVQTQKIARISAASAYRFVSAFPHLCVVAVRCGRDAAVRPPSGTHISGHGAPQGSLRSGIECAPLARSDRPARSG